jgi:hypothetical protein
LPLLLLPPPSSLPPRANANDEKWPDVNVCIVGSDNVTAIAATEANSACEMVFFMIFAFCSLLVENRLPKSL